MADLKEQHIYVKFCFRLTKTALEMHEMLKRAFGGREHRFFLEFSFHLKFGETLVEDYEHSGHPSTGHTNEHFEEVHKIINED
jgi:hypothetical protein